MALAFLLHCKSTVTALHHQTLTTNLRLQSAADRKKKKKEEEEKYPSFLKNVKFTLTHAFGYNYALQDMHQQTFPTLYSRGFFRVSCLKARTSVEFARGIFRHLCGRLKEAEQIKHTNFLLNLKVMFNSTVRDVRSPACVVVYHSAKLPGMVRTSLLCPIIDRHLSSRIISPLFWRPRATLPV